jgi:hypothetical protein
MLTNKETISSDPDKNQFNDDERDQDPFLLQSLFSPFYYFKNPSAFNLLEVFVFLSFA